MNVYQMNEDEWWIGESLQACIEDYIEYSGDPEYIQDAGELDESELSSFIFFTDEKDENDEWIKRTFKEQLAIEIANGGEFPRMFAMREC
ncbi:hypothetical protein [Shewanella algae]|uniref:hypothetical protein n=1 Tax=Shewanella algae TaxID=38313 RepID=UPI0031F56B8E